MDEPVPRRNFVRLVASDVVRNAGRVAAISGAAAGAVAQGMAGLSDVFDDGSTHTPTPDAPVPGVRAYGGSSSSRAATMPKAAAVVARLDDATWALLRAVDHGWLAMNRQGAGPLALPTRYRVEGDRLSIRGRAGSAMALAVAADGNVTLIVDDPTHATRCLVFARAEVLEGSAAAANPDRALDADGALIVVRPTHALRMPA